jgi:hypothetical protein
MTESRDCSLAPADGKPHHAGWKQMYKMSRRRAMLTGAFSIRPAGDACGRISSAMPGAASKTEQELIAGN